VAVFYSPIQLLVHSNCMASLLFPVSSATGLIMLPRMRYHALLIKQHGPVPDAVAGSNGRCIKTSATWYLLEQVYFARATMLNFFTRVRKQ
jgi:hypothetical protein